MVNIKHMNSMVLAIDLGSTRFKAAVFDVSLRRVGFGAGDLIYRFGEGGRVELLEDAVSGALSQAVKTALQGVAEGSIKAIAITSQAQTFTVLDAAGRVKMPFISWQDSRAEEACQALSRETSLCGFAKYTSFGKLLPALQISQLRHLRETRPGIIEPADRVVLLPAYVVWRLSGRAVVDANLAAMSGLYSLPDRNWWDPALAAVGLYGSQLPELVELGAMAAQTGAQAGFFGLAEGVPVILAGNDQTAGAYGAGLEATDVGLVTLGTAQVFYQVTEHLADPGADVIRGPYVDGRYYRMAADSCGGNIINWAQTVLAGCGDDAAFFARAAESPTGCRGLRFNANLPRGTGSWSDCGFQHGPGDFARAVLEELGARMVARIGQMDGRHGRGALKVAGGGSEQRLWLQILEQLAKRPLVKTEASPLEGAAHMAWKVLGGR